MNVKISNLPLTDKTIEELKCGDMVLLSGEIYTGRDMAHKRFCETLKRGEALPVEIKGEVIYYVGAAPKRPGKVVGAAGPTSSKRMDPFTPFLLDYGVKAVIGKGMRDDETVKALVRNKAVYLCAVGGAGALIAESIVDKELICYEELGTEAVYKYRIKDFPCIVGIDCQGNTNIYKKL